MADRLVVMNAFAQVREPQRAGAYEEARIDDSSASTALALRYGTLMAAFPWSAEWLARGWRIQ